MRGEVEIWRGDELVSHEPNMVVDGARKTLADIMTASQSLADIEAASSLLDSSNYTVQAMSFGTYSLAHQANAHYWSDAKENKLGEAGTSYGWPKTNDGTKSNEAFVYYLRQLLDQYRPYHVGLPDWPNPESTVLQEGTDVSAVIGGVAVSSVFPGNGQLCNFLPSGIFSAVMADTSLSTPVSGWCAANVLGCFPEGSSTAGGTVYSTGNAPGARYFDEPDDVVLSYFGPNPQPGGYFNEFSSMDVSGFVNNIMSSVPDADYDASNTAHGLCMSATSESTYEGFDFVEYSLTMSLRDANYANIYGGIYHLGLWTIDIPACLANGNTPPYAFSVLNNPRKYRLFCRKGFQEDITQATYNGGPPFGALSDLTIKWRIHFR
jgi:hypothetical protein